MPDSVFTVTAPAGDLTLLSQAELRLAINLSADDSSQDATLGPLGDRVAARITEVCEIASDGVHPPTLRLETLTETWRFDWRDRAFRASGASAVDWAMRYRNLVLARRPIITVEAISEDGVDLDPTADIEIQSAAGMLGRLWNDQAAKWTAEKVIVTYTAGFDLVPTGLKFAAEKLLRQYWYRTDRDPAVRQINIPGVVERQYFQMTPDHDIGVDILDSLAPYINPRL